MSHEKMIEQALFLLKEEDLNSDRPTIVAISPESPSYLRGNRGGFMRLAIAALMAAQGENQEFRKQSWVRCEDRDWVAGGFQYDESAYAYLPPDPLTVPWWKRKANNALGLVVFSVVVVLLVIGVISVIHFGVSHL